MSLTRTARRRGEGSGAEEVTPRVCGAGRLPGAAGHRALRAVPGIDQHRLAGAMSAADREEGRRMRGFTVVLAALAGLVDRLKGEDPERGDVPGWVMITVMTAALVLAILIPFREAIVAAVQNALSSVTSGG